MPTQASFRVTLAAASIGLLSVSLASAARAAIDPATEYQETKLVSNIPGEAAVTDPNLVNPWGITRSSGSPWWVADNGTGLSTLYNGAGAIQQLVVKIAASDGTSSGTPTGAVFNGTGDFQIQPGKPAIFLFATEDGTVSGWNPQISPGVTQIVINHGVNSVFKGITIATATFPGHATAQYLYVADFRQAKVEIFNTSFHSVGSIQLASDEDNDNDGENAGYAPFNVQNIGGDLYVSYAKQNAARHDEVDGPGLGFVVVYSPEGKRLHRLQRGNFFNAPWGMTLAPSDFGEFSHDLLVGQFGSGEILAFDPVSGRFLGKLNDSSGNPLHIDGLWGLSPGNGGAAGSATSVFFAAGLNHEQDGLFGQLTAVTTPHGNDQ